MRILIVEDDGQLQELLSFQLQQKGYETDTCGDGLEAFDYLEQQVYNLIILDRMLPKMDGIQVLKKLRKKEIATPVIMLTALGEISDRIDGLDAGADDYLVKPFAPEELYARVRALVRRPAAMKLEEKLSFGDIELNLNTKILTHGGACVELSKKEAELLEFFIWNKGQTLTRNVLLARVWGLNNVVEDGNLDNYIYFLRRRLRQVESSVTIRTVRSVGYCLEAS